ncbi:fimbrial biogenesis chaperone [Albibacterium indicum]|uniref:molecular chaperone n=1 Tax=Albibacterium indicum TaxID=2292082 RepID=UPI000E483FA5|nr:molecular chaperone [Pedobacter indicus]
MTSIINFRIVYLLVSIIILPLLGYSQTSLSVSPPRTYFTLGPGQTETKKILVTNPSKTQTLELSVSFNDWEYDSLGNNILTGAGSLKTSAAEWIEILPQSFFSLAPGASHELNVRMRIPENLDPEVPVHTAMIFLTQINPSDGLDERGANIKIAVRSGVKIYHRNSVARDANLEVTGFSYQKDDPAKLRFEFENLGNVWSDGTISCELLNQETGKKTKLEDVVFYSMPGDKRTVYFNLPEDLSKGKYIATALVDYEHASAVKIAELSFSYD